MRLLVMIPAQVEVDRTVEKVVAESVDGSFGLLPQHVDMITELVPGILSYHADGQEHFVAVDGGLLAKVGDEVQVATTQAVVGAGLADLRRVVEQTFHQVEEREQDARAALMRLESDLVQRLVELRELGRG